VDRAEVGGMANNSLEDLAEQIGIKLYCLATEAHECEQLAQPGVSFREVWGCTDPPVGLQNKLVAQV